MLGAGQTIDPSAAGGARNRGHDTVAADETPKERHCGPEPKGVSSDTYTRMAEEERAAHMKKVEEWKACIKEECGPEPKEPVPSEWLSLSGEQRDVFIARRREWARCISDKTGEKELPKEKEKPKPPPPKCGLRPCITSEDGMDESKRNAYMEKLRTWKKCMEEKVEEPPIKKRPPKKDCGKKPSPGLRGEFVANPEKRKDYKEKLDKWRKCMEAKDK